MIYKMQHKAVPRQGSRHYHTVKQAHVVTWVKAASPEQALALAVKEMIDQGWVPGELEKSVEPVPSVDLLSPESLYSYHQAESIGLHAFYNAIGFGGQRSSRN